MSYDEKNKLVRRNPSYLKIYNFGSFELVCILFKYKKTQSVK